MYKNILVPLDGSKRAEAILPHVVALARADGAKVHLLQVVEPDLILDMPDSMTAVREPINLEARKEHAEAYLVKQQSTLRKKDIEVDIQVSHGMPIQRIVDIAEVEDVDLIAIVSHGRTGLARAIFGSVAADVLLRAKRPVFVIRALDR